MMKENTYKIFKFLQENNGQALTSADVADALGLEKRTVDGVFTSAIQRKELGFRTPAEVVDPATGLHKQVKLLSLNDAGMAVDLASELASAE